MKNQNQCDHKVKIPGLDAFLCKKCNKWIVTDKALINANKFKKGKSKSLLAIKIYS